MIVVLSSTNLFISFNNLHKYILTCHCLASGSPCAVQQCAPTVCHLIPDARTSETYRNTHVLIKLLVLALWVFPAKTSALISSHQPVPLSLWFSLKLVLNHCKRTNEQRSYVHKQDNFLHSDDMKKDRLNLQSINGFFLACFLSLHLYVSLSSTRLSICSSTVNCCCICIHI